LRGLFFSFLFFFFVATQREQGKELTVFELAGIHCYQERQLDFSFFFFAVTKAEGELVFCFSAI
jgi:hypothetical protein